MKKLIIPFAVIALGLVGCNNTQNNNQNPDVLSQRYVHKYGYLVSKEEWEEKHFPGQVITTMHSGVTIAATYENGILHGPMTHTFPHSQNVENYYLYNWGECVKEITYNVLGLPIQEKIQLSPTRHSITSWYLTGSPKSVEEYAGEELVDGQYFNGKNDVEARVSKGKGMRIQRAANGTLLSKESLEGGYTVKKETYYTTGTPESLAFYHRGQLNGDKKTFALGGEPLSVEPWVNGQLHGIARYYKNGTKYLEITYRNGEKSGIERHFIDGEIISQEISWESDMKHGPSTFFHNGKPEEQQWFYGGKPVSKLKFDDLTEFDGLFMQR